MDLAIQTNGGREIHHFSAPRAGFLLRYIVSWCLAQGQGGRCKLSLRLHRHPSRSHLSFALASPTVCHCMLLGSSAPPQARGLTWSIT